VCGLIVIQPWKPGGLGFVLFEAGKGAFGCGIVSGFVCLPLVSNSVCLRRAKISRFLLCCIVPAKILLGKPSEIRLMNLIQVMRTVRVSKGTYSCTLAGWFFSGESGPGSDRRLQAEDERPVFIVHRCSNLTRVPFGMGVHGLAAGSEPAFFSKVLMASCDEVRSVRPDGAV